MYIVLGGSHKKSEDHLALVLELLAIKKFPAALRKGKNASKFFNASGSLKNIQTLKPWPIDNVLKEKYNFSKYECCFLSTIQPF